MSKLTRRQWMLTAAASALPTGNAFAARPKGVRHKAIRLAPDGLNDVARRQGLAFGSCLDTGGKFGPDPSKIKRHPGSLDDPRMRALFVEQCGILVPANELKWYALRPGPDKFDFTHADLLAHFANRHGIAMRGHTLLWNRDVWLPKWLQSYDFGADPAAEAERMLRHHITTVCRHYGDRIFSYDVMNEGLKPDTGELEDSVFNKYLGPRVFDVCFNAAREAAPHAQLVYNDYMSWRPKDETHRTAVLKLLERLKKDGVPIDALGIQSHIGSSKEPLGPDGFEIVDEPAWRKFLDEVTGMGLDLVVTEFDVNDRYLPADFETRDRLVAGHGKRYLDILASYPRLRYVMAWGIVDKYSWLQGNTPRPDGLPKRDTPYDSDCRPKALREAMAYAFSLAPARPAMTMQPA